MEPIIVDISRYQPIVDAFILKKAGVELCISKAVSGKEAYPSWEYHYASMTEAGIPIVPYVWVDPSCKMEDQLSVLLQAVSRKNIKVVAFDMEQWWKIWSEWYNWRNKLISKEEVQQFSASSLHLYITSLLSAARKSLPGVKFILYTNADFILSYCPQLQALIEDYLVQGDAFWIAQYPVGAGNVQVSWDEFKATYVPYGKKPTLPNWARKLQPLWDKWKFWQFTGDRYRLDGTYNPLKRISALDVNLFNGTSEELRSFLNFEPEHPTIPSITWEQDIDGWARTKGYSGVKPPE